MQKLITLLGISLALCCSFQDCPEQTLVCSNTYCTGGSISPSEIIVTVNNAPVVIAEDEEIQIDLESGEDDPSEGVKPTPTPNSSSECKCKIGKKIYSCIKKKKSDHKEEKEPKKDNDRKDKHHG